jgi:ParB family transcriptional regulator, chromosome partitioning protein
VARKAGLGRGFGSLIPTDVAIDDAFDPTAQSDEQVSQLRQLPIDQVINNPDQPRQDFDESALDALAESIKEHGILQPIVVTAQGDNYQIVAGERRWRAAQRAGLAKVPAIIRTLSGQHTLELALIENLQREDLGILETATAFLKLRTQFNMGDEQISQRIDGRKAASTIGNIIRLLRLPEAAKKALMTQQVSEGHARQILALEGDEAVQAELLQKIIQHGWSVRQAEQYVQGHRRAKERGREDINEEAIRNTLSETPLTRKISQKIAMPVAIKPMAKGGRLIISYKTEDDLKKIEQLFE